MVTYKDNGIWGFKGLGMLNQEVLNYETKS
jgi:hypothetical protein